MRSGNILIYLDKRAETRSAVSSVAVRLQQPLLAGDSAVADGAQMFGGSPGAHEGHVVCQVASSSALLASIALVLSVASRARVGQLELSRPAPFPQRSHVTVSGVRCVAHFLTEPPYTRMCARALWG